MTSATGENLLAGIAGPDRRGKRPRPADNAVIRTGVIRSKLRRMIILRPNTSLSLSVRLM